MKKIKKRKFLAPQSDQSLIEIIEKLDLNSVITVEFLIFNKLKISKLSFFN